MAQWAGAVDTKPDDLCLIPGMHVVEGENLILPVVLRLPHIGHGMSMTIPTYNDI